MLLERHFCTTPCFPISNQGSVPVAIRDNFFDKYVTSGKRNGHGLGTYSALLIAKTSGGKLRLDTTKEGETTIIAHFKNLDESD